MGSGGMLQALRGVGSLDVRSLVLLRVCIGLVVLIDVVRRADTLEFYTDEGSFIQPPGDTQHRCLFHRAWFYKGTWQLQGLLFALTALSSLCLAAGACTPLANAVSWVGIVAIHGRNECVNDSSDKMLRSVLFWCMVLPLGAAGSVDRARRLRLPLGGRGVPRHPPGWSCEGPQHLSPATVGLLLQVIPPIGAEGLDRRGPGGALPAVSWPRVPACGSLEPPRRDGENAQKTGKKRGENGRDTV